MNLEDMKNPASEEIEVDPLDNSTYCAGWGGSFLYPDYGVSEDGKRVRIIIAFDGKQGGCPTTCTLIDDVIEIGEGRTEQAAALAIEDAIQKWRGMTGHLGRTPIPVQNLRNFIREMQSLDLGIAL